METEVEFVQKLNQGLPELILMRLDAREVEPDAFDKFLGVVFAAHHPVEKQADGTHRLSLHVVDGL